MADEIKEAVKAVSRVEQLNNQIAELVKNINQAQLNLAFLQGALEEAKKAK